MLCLDTGATLYSPSDLVTFLRCRHASFLEAKNRLDLPESSESDLLLQRKGKEHERSYLEKLKSESRSLIEIPQDRPLPERATLTRQAMLSGVETIYQAVLVNGSWHGNADFLLKSTRPSSLGEYSYEILETKLTKTPEASHVIQLCAYSDLMSFIQGKIPLTMYLVLGDSRKYSFAVEDFFFYYSQAKRQFETYHHDVPQESYPEPCRYCSSCRWQPRCQEQWTQDQHLSLIANIKNSQIKRFHAHNITTLAQLAESPLIQELNFEPFLRLQAQARLQYRKIQSGQDVYELIESAPGKGLSRLPPPDEGDLFFDMEGDPLYPQGLEYLFGVYGKQTYRAFWAHDQRQEKTALKNFMAFVGRHLSEFPQAHIYHYNHYEPNALKRLTGRHATCEEDLDRLLRGQVFVDLYLVVQEGLRISEPSYSLKNLETFYLEKRTESVTNAAESIAVYNRWRYTGQADLLKDLETYNEKDCISTFLLRNWLLTLKDDTKTDPIREDKEVVIEEREREREYQAYREKFDCLPQTCLKNREGFLGLLEFHTREVKAQWWRKFERQNQLEEELIEDTESLGGLRQVRQPYAEKRSLIYTYTFPDQVHKLTVGHTVDITREVKRGGMIVYLNEEKGVVQIKRGKGQTPLPRALSVSLSEVNDPKFLRKALYRYADRLLERPMKRNAVSDLLDRLPPRIRGRTAGSRLVDGDDFYAGVLETILGLDESYLFIQGAPGAGKTYISSRLAIDLIVRGYKIGVTSTSHRAIHNLLDRVEEVARERGVEFRGVKKGVFGQEETMFTGNFMETQTNTEDISPEIDLLAGTPWTFAHPHLDSRLDYLFIDEAGQMSTANVVAMATATKNVILVGDQMQLSHPIQGSHPAEAGLSVLEFLLGSLPTIPPDRGIFLDESRRMRASLCRFISEAFYGGRLTPHASTAFRYLDLDGIGSLPNEGIVLIPVFHEGRGQKSVEEGEIINSVYRVLLGRSFIDSRGRRPLDVCDILVITPYNAQKNYLRSILPRRSRIGTVDKFQGQEAPIVLISLATSSGSEMSKGLDFLYSQQRLNVALSRAQCLAVVVADPRLCDVVPATVEQTKLVNTLCRFMQSAIHCDPKPFL